MTKQEIVEIAKYYEEKAKKEDGLEKEMCEEYAKYYKELIK